jgi:hypothetical protein
MPGEQSKHGSLTERARLLPQPAVCIGAAPGIDNRLERAGCCLESSPLEAAGGACWLNAVAELCHVRL